MQLPYDGVFDFIAFSYEKGAVTLMTGHAYAAQLKPMPSGPSSARPASTR